MKILIYRSNDVNIRRYSLFTEEIVEELKDYNIEITMEEESSLSLEKFKSADLIIIFSHGNDWAIFHKLEDQNGEEKPHYETLITTKKRLDLLKGKKVLAFACYTAIDYVGLGDVAVREAGCVSYLGFEGAINRHLPEEFIENISGETEIDVKNFISSVYSVVFKSTIIEAIKKNFTFDYFAKTLKLRLKQQIAKQIINNFDGKIHIKFHTKGAKPVHETADSIRIRGDMNVSFIA
ncbi:hypothetical protein [Bacillus altitudinis]|uniref:hypothetical protein n=1 Tax=Bacillus altitudinis TaxID=293387 RepID=UPI00148E9D7A|nr:hypothetical protein [Bacillus altitudinis]NOL31117.1 hypothetical protein [Bacillus altitudinis]